MTTPHHDLGTERDPVMAGAPVRLECTAGMELQFGTVDYALFRLDGDSIVTPPAFVLSSASGEIEVTSGPAGLYSVLMTTSHTAMWSGRDWHCARFQLGGIKIDLFHGLVTSTGSLVW